MYPQVSSRSRDVSDADNPSSSLKSSEAVSKRLSSSNAFY